MGSTLQNGSTLLMGGANLPARVSAQDAKGISTTTSASATYAGATTSGNVLIASVYTDGAAPAISGWTSTTQSFNSAASFAGQFAKVADGTETTISATSAGATIMKIHIYEYTNVDASLIFDVGPLAVNGTGVASRVTSSVTTNNSRDLLFATWAMSGAVTSPNVSNMNIRQQDAASIQLFDADLIPDALETAFTATGSWTTLRNATAMILALKPKISSSSNEPGIKITFNASAPAGQFAFQTFDYLNSPIWVTGNSGNKVSQVFGDKLRAYNGNNIPAGFDGRNGRAAPAGMIFPQNRTTDGGPRVFSGSGAPAVDTAIIGDIWLRTDTPSTSNQRVYQCTTAGNPGTWAARL